MEFYQLKQFITVVECQSMQKAAELLFISQPALSKSIKKLEDEFHCDFFTRSKGKKLLLNENGKKFYHYAQTIFHDVQILYDEFTPVNPTIIRYANEGSGYLKSFLKYYILKHPSLQISTSIMTYHQIIKALSENALDVGVTMEPVVGSKNDTYEHYHCIFFHRLRLFLSVDPSSPYAHFKKISLHKLRDIPLIRQNNHCPREEWLDELGRQAGIRFTSICNVDLDTLLYLLTENPHQYNTVFSSLNIETNAVNVCKNRINIPIDDPHAQRDMKIYYSKTATPEIRNFVQSLIHYYYHHASGTVSKK